MTMISSDTKQVLIPEAEKLGYAPPVITPNGHLLWEHPGTKQRVLTHARLNGRGVRNARAMLRRRARGGA